MSSTASSTHLRSIPNNTFGTKPHNNMKTQKLVRTSSLEKIRRFNTFICSQQYYVVPALLTWLKSSQSGLQSATEKTIFFFRSLIFNNFVYKLYKLEFKAQLLKFKDVHKKDLSLKIAVAFIVFALFSQLLACFYLLLNSQLPGGLVFLIVCCFYIIHINYRSIVHSLKEKRIRFIKREDSYKSL